MKSTVTVRNYRSSDCEKVAELFYETVHTVNAEDYTAEQLFAWAKDERQLQTRKNDLIKQNTLIAEIDGNIVGYVSMTDAGYLDLLYIHKDFQRKGIATKLCDELERGFSVVVTHASVTAKPFFEKRGYSVMTGQTVERSGVKLKNYKMQKILTNVF